MHDVYLTNGQKQTIFLESDHLESLKSIYYVQDFFAGPKPDKGVKWGRQMPDPWTEIKFQMPNPRD